METTQKLEIIKDVLTNNGVKTAADLTNHLPVPQDGFEKLLNQFIIKSVVKRKDLNFSPVGLSVVANNLYERHLVGMKYKNDELLELNAQMILLENEFDIIFLFQHLKNQENNKSNSPN